MGRAPLRAEPTGSRPPDNQIPFEGGRQSEERVMQGDGGVTPVHGFTLPARCARSPSLKGGSEEGSGYSAEGAKKAARVCGAGLASVVRLPERGGAEELIPV